MEKALQLLKEQKNYIPYGHTYDARLDEAIKELEEAMKPKTCEGCKHNDTKLKMCNYEYTCIRQLIPTVSDGYEPKDNA